MRHGIRIAGTGSYLPQRAVTSRKLARQVGAPAGWIEEKTGIRSRRFAAEGQSTADLAVAASRSALRAAGAAPRDLDLVLATTLSPDRHFPGIAVDVQAGLKCGRIPSFDVQAQCNGFLFGLSLAAAYISSGQFRRVLLVSSEIHSRDLRFDRSDRDLSILFGDGAGAVVIEKADPEKSFASFLLHSDGHFAADLACPRPFLGNGKHGILLRPARLSAAGLRSNFTNSCEAVPLGTQRSRTARPQMNKTSVIVHSSRSLAEVSLAILEREKISLADIDHVIPHQSNLHLIREFARRLDVPASKCVVNIASVGNTSSASIPIALDGAVRSRRVRRGHLLLLASFGAGFSWGSALVKY